MKLFLKPLLALLVLAMLSPGISLAQWQNEMGLYTEDMSSNVLSEPFVTHNVYLVLTNPYNDHLDQPVEWIHGYECMLVPEGPSLLLTLEFPVDAVNVGDFHSHIVGYGQNDVHVVDGAAVIATLEVIYMGTGEETFWYLKPVDENQSVPGKMAYLDGEASGTESLIGATSVAGDWDSPVFAINADPEIVATDSSTFDNIKAMYR